MLAGANVVLGVSGSLAAVKCVELAHEFRRHGASVQAVTTPSSEAIIHPWALEFATERPVVTEITGGIEHVALCGRDGWGDVLVLAPSTANTIGKAAAAIDDTPVTTCTTTALGAELPIVIAPAMHEPMWEHPGVLEAIETLEGWGVSFVPPRLEEGKAKIAEEDTIITETRRALAPQELEGTSILVTSGATTEAIDPVRVLTNRASGRTGRAIARECYVRGADVTLVHDGPAVPYANTVCVETGEEMRESALEHASEADALISAAAIGDFSIDASAEKLDSSQAHRIDLEPAPKLLDSVRSEHPELAIVGFKAEADASDNRLIEAARDQLERVNCAFVVANDASVMGDSDTRVLLVDREETQELAGKKATVAGSIADRLAEELQQG